jgi:hypothetical protein
MLRELIPVSSDNYPIQTNTPYGKNAEVLNSTAEDTQIYR